MSSSSSSSSSSSAGSINVNGSSSPSSTLNQFSQAMSSIKLPAPSTFDGDQAQYFSWQFRVETIARTHKWWRFFINQSTATTEYNIEIKGDTTDVDILQYRATQAFAWFVSCLPDILIRNYAAGMKNVPVMDKLSTLYNKIQH